MEADFSGDADCVILLLSLNDPLATDDRGTTALIFTVLSENTDCVRALLPVSDPSAVNK